MKMFHIILFVFVMNLVTACGGGGAGDNTSVNDSSSEDTSLEDTSSDGSARGAIDLVDYLFDDNLDTVGDKVSYKVNIYSMDTGEVMFSGLSEDWEKTKVNTYVSSVADSPANTFAVGENIIVETVHGSPDLYRDMKRYVDVGEKYMDATADTPLLGEQNASCVVEKVLSSYDLSTATGSHNIVSGIYNDVLEVKCVTKLVGSNAVLADMYHYFARGVGAILNTGNAIFIGDSYIVPIR